MTLSEGCILNNLLTFDRFRFAIYDLRSIVIGHVEVNDMDISTTT